MEPDVLDFTDYDTRLGAYAVIVRDGHVLLALWNEPTVPTWTLPGGGVELDESPEQAAVREVREETGYDVELGALLGVDTFVMTPEQRFEPVGRRPQKNVRVFYAATVVGGELRDEVDGSTDEARWIPLADVPGLVREPMVSRYVG
ncbi:NUDIX hydrolase [Nocardioides mangrovi]|uniref:NUDIX hydrolase n=1 Tax=Nocardioides mangrovi TaxID=2874580 RepID=A0ABS7UBZ1_9ACTN|nr:NUDIX hydrolase [Nocardioides mangrovi]MBZ5738302.1 NUDIX hydrolase [Nocardioides mangrovi]